MASEAYYLVADGVLEAEDHADGNNHHGQSDSYSDGSYANGGTADVAFLVFGAVNSSCYE